MHSPANVSRFLFHALSRGGTRGAFRHSLDELYKKTAAGSPPFSTTLLARRSLAGAKRAGHFPRKTARAILKGAEVNFDTLGPAPAG